MTKVLQLQRQHQSFQWIFRIYFLEDWLVWSYSPRDSQESSFSPQLESINSFVLSLLYGPTLTSIHDYWKSQFCLYRPLSSKWCLCFFNTLSRFVTAFLPRSKHLLIFQLVTIHSDFVAQENKICHCFHFSPIYVPWSGGTGYHILVFWMLSFKLDFSFSSFTLISKLLLLSAIRVISSAHSPSWKSWGP